MPHELDPIRLTKAIDRSFDQYSHAHQASLRFLVQLAGRFYAQQKPGSNEEQKATPINLMHRTLTTLVSNLVPRDPQLSVTTEVLDYRDYAQILGKATTMTLRQARFKKTLRLVVMDSLVSCGFVKSGIAAGRMINFEGFDMVEGAPFIERVAPQHMILDPEARAWDEQNIIGDKYRMRQDKLIEAGFDPTMVENIGSQFRHRDSDKENIRISVKKGIGRETLYDWIDLVDIWQPETNLVYTMPYKKGHRASEYLRVSEHVGPDTGPYHMLGYTWIGDNILPVPPASLVYDIHVLINRVSRKIGRQAERAKRVLAVDGGSVDDLAAIQNAPDGEAVVVNNLGGVKELQYGGTTDEMYQYSAWLEQHGSVEAANVDQLSGTRTNAPTLGQSEILQNNTFIRISDLQDQVHDFIASVGRSVVFTLHTDPFIELPLTRRVDGIDQQVVYSPETRKGEFIDYVVSIVPFSMVRRDPSTQTRQMLELLTVGLPALAQAAQILGPAFKIETAWEDITSRMGMEGLDWLDQQTFFQVFMNRFASGLEPGKAGSFLQPGSESSGILGKIGQPNPGQMGPIGGISEQQIANADRQRIPAEVQSRRFI